MSAVPVSADDSTPHKPPQPTESVWLTQTIHDTGIYPGLITPAVIRRNFSTYVSGTDRLEKRDSYSLHTSRFPNRVHSSLCIPDQRGTDQAAFAALVAGCCRMGVDGADILN